MALVVTDTLISGIAVDRFHRREEDFQEEMHILSKVLLGCDVTELVSPIRVAQVCGKYRLRAGSSFDLRTGWDLSQPSVQRKVIEAIDNEDPELLICSPPCTMFSRLNALNCHVLGPEWAEQRARDRDKAKFHINFCVNNIRARMRKR
jgi:hypothetical protein